MLTNNSANTHFMLKTDKAMEFEALVIQTRKKNIFFVNFAKQEHMMTILKTCLTY